MLKQFNINNIRVLHLEPTTNCNAACPQCSRAFTEFYDHNINHNELTVAKIKDTIKDSFIKRLDKMYVCGNFGDPAVSNNTKDILDYFRSINPTITLGMNTNGGVRTSKWWADLALRFNNKEDYVIFSIDGLEDTNHIYRKNVIWNKVIKNAKEFINAGGNAHWEMIVYKHNEHQVEEAEQIAKELGFKFFRVKISRRNSIFPIEYLESPTNWTEPKETTCKINCQALNDNSVYMSATGQIFPCCWLGAKEFKEGHIKDWLQLVKNWDTKPNQTCSDNCGTTSFTDQWRKEVEF